MGKETWRKFQSFSNLKHTGCWEPSRLFSFHITWAGFWRKFFAATAEEAQRAERSEICHDEVSTDFEKLLSLLFSTWLFSTFKSSNGVSRFYTYFTDNNQTWKNKKQIDSQLNNSHPSFQNKILYKGLVTFFLENDPSHHDLEQLVIKGVWFSTNNNFIAPLVSSNCNIYDFCFENHIKASFNGIFSCLAKFQVAFDLPRSPFVPYCFTINKFEGVWKCYDFYGSLHMSHP